MNTLLNVAMDNSAGLESEIAQNIEQAEVVEQVTQQPTEEPEEIEKKAEENNEAADDDMLFIGDRITINTRKYGKTTGTIYYLNTNNMLKIMPDGTSNILISFPLIDGEFDPELEVLKDSEGDIDITRHEKGPHKGFVVWQSFRVDQILEGIKGGNPTGKYKIVSINDKEDRITLQRQDAEENEILVDFNFEGIPSDMPFDILRIAAVETPIETPVEDTNEAEEPEEELLEEYELAPLLVVKTIASEERIYPEITQKSEMKADLLSYLLAASQKNPKNIKKIRTIVELFSSLKNSIIKRSADGSVIGEEQISLQTLNDILSNRRVPVVRPVLDTKRIIMSEHPTTTSKDLDQVLIRNLIDTIEKSDNFLKTLGDIPAAEEGAGMPRWFQALNSYFQRYPLGDAYSSGYAFTEDAEYFRREKPGSKTLEGIDGGLDGSDGISNPFYEGENIETFITNIKQSLRRGHGPTVRGLVKGGTEVVIPADKAPVSGYVLFPYRAVLSGYVGAIRTGTLWDIVLRSMSEYSTMLFGIYEGKEKIKAKTKAIWMEKILENLGGISDVRDAQNILYLDATNISATSIPFSLYLEMVLQTVVIGGPGDLSRIKSNLGISEIELNIEQEAIVKKRIQEVIASVRTMIRQLREETKQPPPPKLDSVLEGDYVSVITSIFEGEKNLGELYNKMRKLLPGYKSVDLAIFSYLFKQNQNYLLACLSKDPLSIKRERVLYNYDTILKILTDKNQERELERNKGFPPKPNPCAHTNNLTIIRKVKNSQERIALLKIFLRKFKGERRENWVHCTICDQHLICHHEVLQIQQFIHPREHTAIQKEIVLGYAGGTFGKNYICRNCGLPIAEMSYDTSIEYGDDGKPMSGRSELVDQDSIDREELELLLGPRVEKVTEIEFETTLKTECYKIAKVICNRIGVSLDNNGYNQVVDRSSTMIQQEIPGEVPYKALGRKEPYPRYVTGNKIAIVAALTLIEIQCKTPSYVIEHVLEGCKPGFSGYPLVVDAKPESEEESVGINYMVCALAGFYPTFSNDSKTEKPPRLSDIWLNGPHKIKDTKTRTAYIKQLIINYLGLSLENDTKIQGDLEKKRKYISNLYGVAASKGKYAEKISPGFLPRLTNDALEEPLVNEGAKGNLGEEQQATAWIRGANFLAKKTANIIKGNPMAETSCCQSNISEPGEFFKKSGLPALPTFYSLKRSFARQSILYPAFIPRPLQESIGTLALDLSYRVFIQICWKGPRTGKAHEIGYDNKCAWCDLEIPVDYLYPDVALEDPSWKGKRLKEEQEKAAAAAHNLQETIKVSFTTQGVSLDTEESLQGILDAAHARTSFNNYKSPNVQASADFLNDIASVDLPPISSWPERIQQSLQGLQELNKDATAVSIALALKPLEDGIAPAIDGIKTKNGRLGPGIYNFIEGVLTQEPEAIIEIIRSYLLVPLQRIRKKYQSDVTLRIPEQYRKGTAEKLSEDHIKELETIMDRHTKYLQTFNEESPLCNSDLGILKIDYFVEQITSLLQYSSELRISRMQFSDKISVLHMELLLKMLMRSLLFGTMWDLLNPQFTPEIEEEIDFSSEKDSVHNALRTLIRDLIIQYQEEKLSYNPAEVREKIAEAKEKEKQGFIQILDVLNDEERKIELIKKRAKIGRWAQGTGKLAYSYDPDDYDRRRLERDGNGAEEYVDPNPTEGEGYDAQDEQQKEEGEE
jgi:hypothetical protein